MLRCGARTGGAAGKACRSRAPSGTGPCYALRDARYKLVYDTRTGRQGALRRREPTRARRTNLAGAQAVRAAYYRQALLQPAGGAAAARRVDGSGARTRRDADQGAVREPEGARLRGRPLPALTRRRRLLANAQPARRIAAEAQALARREARAVPGADRDREAVAVERQHVVRVGLVAPPDGDRRARLRDDDRMAALFRGPRGPRRSRCAGGRRAAGPRRRPRRRRSPGVRASRSRDGPHPAAAPADGA